MAAPADEEHRHRLIGRALGVMLALGWAVFGLVWAFYVPMPGALRVASPPTTPPPASPAPRPRVAAPAPLLPSKPSRAAPPAAPVGAPLRPLAPPGRPTPPAARDGG